MKSIKTKKVKVSVKHQEVSTPSCETCKGSGRHLPEQTCPICNGTGKK